MLIMHLMGVPLVGYQAELTALQRCFVENGLPRAYQKVHGGGQ